MRKIRIGLFMLFVFYILLPTWVFSQTHNGWFLAYSRYWIASDLYENASAVGDVDDNSQNDLVACKYDAVDGIGRIFVFIQNAGRELNDYVSYDGGNGFSVDIGDLNNDGRNDVVVSTNNGIGVFYQNNSNTLDPIVEYPCSSSGYRKQCVRVADFNGDNLLDVVASGRDHLVYRRRGEIDVFIQDSGTFLPSTRSSVTIDINDMDVGDLNNDGLADVAVVGNSSGDTVAVLTQNAGGGLNAPAYYDYSTYTPKGCAIGNVDNSDGNNLNDLAVISGSMFRVFSQNAGGTLDSPATYGLPAGVLGSIITLDVDRNGRTDVVLPTSYNLMVSFQRADGTMGDAEYYKSFPTVGNPGHDVFSGINPQGIRSGDLNGDGMIDVVQSNGYDGTVAVYWGWNQSVDIVIIRPTHNELFQVGTQVLIEWGEGVDLGPLNIAYSIDGGNNWNTIATDYNNTNDSYLWTVPYTPSSNCYVRIYSSLSGVEDMEGPFTIEDDGVDRIILTSPNGGENLVAGNTHDITWSTTGSIDNVRIEYTTDNGANWTDIVASTYDDGSYTWTVPNEVSSQCLVRISDEVDGDPTDTSANPFSIVDASTEIITVTSPNGGESLDGDSTYAITWQATSNIALVALAYSIDNGSNWTNIGTTPNTGSYNWMVPGVNSSQCLVRIRDASDSDPSDVSDNTFSISTIVGPSITVLSPNGGEFLFIGNTHTITWQSTTAIVGNVRIQYSIDNGASWANIVSSTENDGSYDWTVPNTPSSQCLVRIREASDGDPSDTSDSVFTIAEWGATLSITSPQNNDLWQVGAKHDIKWVSGTAVSNYVKLEYSTNNQTTWNTIVSSTANDGKYTWTVPNTPADTCNVKISDVDGYPSNISYGSFSIISGSIKPVISLNRTSFYFGWVKSSTAQTGPQTITVDNGGAGTLKWYVTFIDDGDNENESQWLKLSNTSGTQSGQVEMYIEPVGLNPGTHDAILKFYDNNASNSPQMVNVFLEVYPPDSDSNPFGSFETPVDGSTVMSSIPVTGWALDDTGIEKVTIWRNAVSGEGGGQIYIGDAVLVDGARPDVEQTYPTYPMSYKAGWGYMMLTNFLPNGGNGTFTLHAYARDTGGNEVKLGSKTIVCNNASAVKPFGAMDTPAQGGAATGTNYRNQGWVLTPMPNKIPENGSTIKVYIDGQNIGTCHYNILREDILALFPGYANSAAAMAYFDLDTTVFSNGIHTIQWTATDNAGNTDGIGSRYFTIQNSGYNRQNSSDNTQLQPGNPLKIPLNRSQPIEMKTGFNPDTKTRALKPDQQGIIHITIPQDERIVLDLKQPQALSHFAYLKVKDQLRPLPPGAAMDTKRGIFYWQPGPASLGKYPLVFISINKTDKSNKKIVNITITPKSSR